MKTKKFAVRLIIAMLLGVMLLGGCQRVAPEGEGAVIDEHPLALSLELDEAGLYRGFQGLTEGYTPEQAEADGCYVNIDYEVILGEARLEAFLTQAEAGKDAFLRIVSYFPDEERPGETRVHYGDLFYQEGQYRYFTSSDEGAGQREESLRDEPYQYCRRLDWPPANRPEQVQHHYVLTDDLELTYEDIFMAMISSQFNAGAHLPPYVMITGLGF